MPKHVYQPKHIAPKKSLLGLHIFMLALVVGLSLILYPFVGTQFSNWQQAKVLSTQVSKYQSQDFSEQLAKARDFNSMVSKKQAEIISDDSVRQEFNQILSFGDGFAFGRVTIESVGIDIPLYKGTTDDVLEKGAGLFYGGSLPVGGESTNAVITAHTGLPNASMFDNLKNVKNGDLVLVSTGGQTLGYKVISSEVLSPEQAVEKSFVEAGKDLITLVTCTPYSVNTHRLVVVAERDKDWHLPDNQTVVPVKSAFPWLSLILVVLVVTSLILLYLWQLGILKKRHKARHCK